MQIMVRMARRSGVWLAMARLAGALMLAAVMLIAVQLPARASDMANAAGAASAAVSSDAAAWEAIRLDAPESVAEGQAFIVTVAADRPIKRVDFHWLGRSVGVEPAAGGNGQGASVMLGMGMRERLEGDAHLLRAVARFADGRREAEATIRREPLLYPEERLTVSRRFSKLTQEDLRRHYREKKLVAAALATVSGERHYEGPMLRPVPGRVTSPFGIRRWYNGVKKRPHSGVDYAAGPGQPIKACWPGRVILSGDHYFAGGSVYIDHGHGVISMYYHMSGVAVREGRFVEKGHILGPAGSTGRVTGPHLHFGLSILGQLVDPHVVFERSQGDLALR